MTDKFIGDVLKHQMHLKYKRIKMIAWKGNSERCLVLRQQCAKYLLQQMNEGAILVSVDQSWLSTMGYTRRKWRSRNETNSVPVKQLSPKINLIGACDSEGGVYNACTQTNTTSKVMITYLMYLHEEVCARYPDRIQKVLYLLDGAGYHRSQETRQFVK